MYSYKEYTFDVIGNDGSKRWRVYATPEGLLINYLTGQARYGTTYEAHKAAQDWIDRQLAAAADKIRSK